MFVKSYCSALAGIRAMTVAVEVNISPGIGMFLVGLPDNAVRESQERIRAAFDNSSFKMSGRKVVVNLSPADLRKEGSGYDLSIAVAILGAMGLIEGAVLERYTILGELSLDGSVLPVKGVLPAAIEAKEQQFEGIILPQENALEAAVVDGLKVYGVKNLREVVEFLQGERAMEPTEIDLKKEFEERQNVFEYDFSDVKGQTPVKRALEIAAAGGHNILMIGPPGSGQTMLARRMPSITPPLTLAEALETTKIHSVAGKLGQRGGLLTTRPFRAPHHLTSQVALVGGGSTPQPGEISLSHNGILFLDELPEFGRNALETLRQPMEDKKVVVSRSRYTVEYPANFMLIAAMNPCPCGYYNHPTKTCVCSKGAAYKYINQLSGPLLDRIDLQIEVTPVPFEHLNREEQTEPSAAIRARVMAARERQTRRLAGTSAHTNAMMSSRQLRECCPLDEPSAKLLKQAMERLELSARAYDRIVKVARTIADLSASEAIRPEHIAEAIRYRSLDRSNWGA